jgi:LysR family glycine cleavage system transcriptional activator
MKLPPLTALRAFAAVARHLSVRRAAEELRVDHTVVSRHLHALQASLELQLVETSRQGVRLTPAGQEYAAAILPAFAAIDAATARLETRRSARKLTVWCIPGFALHWLTPRLAELHRHYPHLEVALRPTEQHPDFATGEADAEIRYGRPSGRGVRHATLLVPRMYPVASPGFLAAHPGLSSPADLLTSPLIHEESPAQWRAWFIACGLEAPQQLPGPCLWHAYLAIEAARRGQGVALANDLLAGEEIGKGLLRPVTSASAALAPYCFVAHSARWDDPTIGRFRRWLIATLRAPRE